MPAWQNNEKIWAIMSVLQRESWEFSSATTRDAVFVLTDHVDLISGALCSRESGKSANDATVKASGTLIGAYDIRRI